MELKDLLLAREQRAEHQRQLLKRYGLPLICFTLNIPGPTKNSPLITEAFLLGEQRLKAQFPKRIYEEHRLLPTGCEGYYIVPLPAQEIKDRCMLLEAQPPLGRLLDLDVLLPDGQKLSRSAPRPCFLCGEDARLCRRRGSHSIESLAQKATELMEEALDLALSEQVGALAVRSLLYELLTTPKPGLVDQRNSGSHKDMDAFTFAASASALGTYFCRCASEGAKSRGAPAQSLLPTLRFLGREAECSMYMATGGINTHKGAIFSLGLLCAAAGRLEHPLSFPFLQLTLEEAAPTAAPQPSGERLEHPLYSPFLRSPFEETAPTAASRPSAEQSSRVALAHALCKEAAAIVKGITARELHPLTQDTAATKGQRLFLSHGITGARGQAEAGFPAVLSIGLPVLESGLQQGLSLHRAGAAALLAMLAQEPDTAFISRSSPERYEEIRRRLRAILERNPYPGEEELLALDREFISEGLSPGGSADLLAVCYFLSAPNRQEHLPKGGKRPIDGEKNSGFFQPHS